MKVRVWLVIAVIAALATLGILAGSNEVKKLSANGVVGKSGDVQLIVDYDAARLRGGEKFIPLKIWLGSTAPKPIYADRGSFTLKDPSGKAQPLAGTDEVLKGYGPNLIGSDYGYYANLSDYGSTSFLSCTEVERVAFFANPGGNPKILYDTVELPRQTYCWTLLYFANPAGKAAGPYTLIYDDPKSKTHIEVPFTVPWQEHKKK